MKRNKKGQVANLMPLVTGLVAIGITLVIGFLILSEIASQPDVVADQNASAAIDETQDAMSDIPGWLSIIIVAAIGALLLGLVQFFRTSGR